MVVESRINLYAEFLASRQFFFACAAEPVRVPGSLADKVAVCDLAPLSAELYSPAVSARYGSSA